MRRIDVARCAADGGLGGILRRSLERDVGMIAYPRWPWYRAVDVKGAVMNATATAAQSPTLDPPYEIAAFVRGGGFEPAKRGGPHERG